MKFRGLKSLGIGSDIGLTAVLQGVGAVAAFAVQAVIVRALSKDEAGSYFLALTYIVIATSIADFGIVATVFPRLARARGAETPSFRAGIVVRTLAVVLGWSGINAYLLVFGDPSVIVPVNVGYCAIVFSVKFSGIRQFLEVLWRLQGRTYVVSIIAVFDMLLTLALIGLFWYMGRLTATTAMLALPLGSIPGFVIVALPLVRQLRMSSYFRRPIPMRYYRRITLAALPIAVMVIFGQTFGQLETLVIHSQLELSDVAAYSAAVRPLNGTIFLAVVVAIGILPVVSQALAGTRREVSLGDIISVSVRIVGLMGLAIIAGCFVFDMQIMGIFGPEYLAEAYILRIYSITNCLIFLVILLDNLLLSAGRRTRMLVGAVFSFVVALLLELAVIVPYGMTGMMYAKIAAITLLICYQLHAVGREMRAAALDGVRKLLLPAVVLAVALLVTSELQLTVRVVLVFALLAGSILMLKTFSIAELRMLRAIRAT